MTHLTLEYTDNLPQFDAAGTLQALNEALVASGHFDEIDIKSRAVRLDTFLVGTAHAGRGFASVRLAILSGRPTEVKQALSASLLHVLKQRPGSPAGMHVQLCVEILEIDRETYAKASLAP